jgi:hypothetical protein
VEKKLLKLKNPVVKKKSLLKRIKKIVAKVIIIRRIKTTKVAEENAAILNVVVLLLATHPFLLMN